jgi:type III secretory pathway component EscS
MVRRLPPIAEIAVAAMALIIVGGITLASRMPRPAPLPLLVALLAVAAVLVLADVVLLARLREFAWPLFFQVAKWSLLAYAVMYGMLEFTFLYDHVGGSTLVVLTLMLIVIAVDVPLLFGFSVARYAGDAGDAGDAGARGRAPGAAGR